MEKTIEILIDMGINLSGKILAAIIIIVIGFKLSKLFIKLIKKRHGFNKLDRSVQTFTLSFASILTKTLVLLMAASVLGIPTASIIALLGSAGIAVGLALQGGLSNIAGGLMLLIFKPFVVGDYIETIANSGTVTKITMFYTELLTADNKRIVLPNADLSNKPVVNYSTMPTRRIELNFTIPYEKDTEKIIKLITEICNNHDLVLKNEEIFVRLTDYNEKSLVYTVRVWVKSDDFFTVTYDIKEQVKASFDKNKVYVS